MPFRPDLIAVYCVSFLVAWDPAILVPNLLGFIQSLESNNSIVTLVFYLTIALSAAASMICAPLGSLAVTRLPYKLTLMFILCFVIIGNLIYSAAATGITGFVWLVPVGRVVASIGGGAIGPCLAYISSKTTETERLRAIAIFQAVASFAPIPALLVAAGVSFVTVESGAYTLDALTIPPFVTAALAAVVIAAVAVLVPMDKRAQDPKEAASVKYLSAGVFVSLFLLFFLGFVISSVSTILPPIFVNIYAWGAWQLGVFVAVCSLTGILGAVSAHFVGRVPKLRKIGFDVLVAPLLTAQTIGIIVLCFGTVFFFPSWIFELVLIFIGFVIVFYTNTFCNVLMITTYSKIMPERSVVAMMGWVTAVINLGKIVGPLTNLVTLLIYEYYLYFAVLMITSIVAVGVAAILNRFYSPIAWHIDNPNANAPKLPAKVALPDDAKASDDGMVDVDLGAKNIGDKDL